MKRFVALSLLFCMFAAFAGCDSGSSSSAPPAEKPATTGAETK